MRARGLRAALLWITALNAALCFLLLIATFEPVRTVVADATGLWRGCVPVRSAGDAERWSPWLLVFVIPPSAVALWLSARAVRVGLAVRWPLTSSLVLLGLAVGLVMLPAAVCAE
jgi:hypothetical protein